MRQDWQSTRHWPERRSAEPPAWLAAVFTETLNWYEAWLQGESMHLPSQSAVCRALAV
jgi:hypothetical protein